MSTTRLDAQFFGEETIPRILLKIAPPVMLAQLIQAAVADVAPLPDAFAAMVALCLVLFRQMEKFGRGGQTGDAVAGNEGENHHHKLLLQKLHHDGLESGQYHSSRLYHTDSAADKRERGFHRAVHLPESGHLRPEKQGRYPAADDRGVQKEDVLCS